MTEGLLYVASFGSDEVLRYEGGTGAFVDVFMPATSGVDGPIDVVFRPCPADLDGSGAVDTADLIALLAAWGDAGGPADLDGSGIVDTGDLIVLLAAWGPCA